MTFIAMYVGSIYHYNIGYSNVRHFENFNLFPAALGKHIHIMLPLAPTHYIKMYLVFQ